LSGKIGAGGDQPAGDGPAQIELWCVDLAAAAPVLDAVERRIPRLAASDRERAEAFSDQDVIAERRATYIALRILIERAGGSHWRGVPLQRGTHGKPHLDNASVSFSYSHATGIALIGITCGRAKCGPIGVDIERARAVHVRVPRRDGIEIAGAALAKGAALPADADARFLQAWVRLEALAKLRGTGVGRLLSKLRLMGGEASTPTEIRSRVESALGEEPAAAVHDLQIDRRIGQREGLFAAVAAPLTVAVAQPQWFPTSVEGIETLLARSRGGLDVDRAGGAGQKGHGGA
jgi:4'-phosphopantetheinyl transferase